MILYYICKDSICNDPKLILGSYVDGPNNKICKEWAKRLGFGHWTVVSHGIHDNHSGGPCLPKMALSSARFGRLWFLALLPFSGLLPSPFYTSLYPSSNVHV